MATTKGKLSSTRLCRSVLPFPDSSTSPTPSIIPVSLSLYLATYANIIRRFLGRAKKVSRRAPRVYGRIKDLRGVIQQSGANLAREQIEGSERTARGGGRVEGRAESLVPGPIIEVGVSFSFIKFRDPFPGETSPPRFVKWNDPRL